MPNRPTPITNREVMQRAEILHEKMRTWRRTIHRYPELGFNETRTANLIYNELINLDIETETGIAKTGVIGQIYGHDGPTVGLRADMDALPIQEQNGTDFDSLYPGLMHACGHDVHTAILLGAGTILQEFATQGRLPGSVRLLFQPSEENQDEEGKSGGMRMVGEGALNGLDAIFALHVDPTREVGMVATRSGTMMASVDTFLIELYGQGGHAAHPHRTIDTIALSAQVIQAIHQIVSRRLNPVDSGVITIGTIQGGRKENIMADNVTMAGTIRALKPQSRQLLRDELRRACQLIELFGGRYELHLKAGYPAAVNHPQAYQVMMSALSDLLGSGQIATAAQSMGAEDFAVMAQEVPGCFMRLGTHNPTWERQYHLHTPTFRVDEDALPIGAAALVATALGWMNGSSNLLA
ncbi:amidohydrolase [Anaerolineales bacterium HSG24]|nr:amidohydrolase [Anaerolineales bacterium HSG24]